MTKFLKSKSIQNVIKISGGTMMGQIISIITLPIITRLYGAEIMGIWTTILSVALIVQAVSDLGLSNSIMVEDEEEKNIVIYNIVNTLTLLISLLSSIVFFIFFFYVKRISLHDSLVYVVLGVIYAYTVKQISVCYTWLNRNKNYDVLMKNPVINYSVMAVFSLGLGIVGFKEYGYFIGVILGQLVTLLHMKRSLPHSEFNFNRKDYCWIVKKYSSFIKYQTPSTLMFQFRDQVPNLLIGALFGNTVLGYYSVSVKILNLPVTFIGQAIGKVFYQSASELKRNGQKIGEFVYRNIGRAILIATVPIFGLYVVGDIFAVMFFGNDYILAGMILRIVVFKAFFSFISVSTQGLEIVLDKQQYSVIMTVLQTVFSCIGISLGYFVSQNIITALVIMSVLYIVIELWFYKRMYAVMEISLKKQLVEMALIFIGVIVFGLIMRMGIYYLITTFKIDYLQWFTV